jgi:hypothetical protein
MLMMSHEKNACIIAYLHMLECNLLSLRLCHKNKVPFSSAFYILGFKTCFLAAWHRGQQIRLLAKQKVLF